MISVEKGIQYHAWATAKMMSLLEGHPEIFTKVIQSAFPSMKACVEHMYDADLIWFTRLKESSFVNTREKPFNDIFEAKIKFIELHADMYNFSINQDLERSIQYTNSLGEVNNNSISEMVYHIVNHGTYHRGNITAMLWSQGLRSVSTDYVYFLRGDM